MKKAEKWALAVPSIISVMALILSLYTPFDRKSFDDRHKDSKILIRMKPIVKEYVEFRDSPMPDVPAIVREYQKIILSNNGDVGASIVDMEIRMTPIDVLGKKTNIWFAGLDPALEDYFGHRIKIPFEISPGESKELYVSFGQWVDRQAWEKLQPNVKINSKIDRILLKRLMYEKNIPVIGRHYAEIVLGKGVTSTKGDYPPKDEEDLPYTLRFTKANGIVVAADFYIFGEIYGAFPLWHLWKFSESKKGASSLKFKGP